MPRISKRRYFIKQLEDILSKRQHFREIRLLESADDQWEDDLDIYYFIKLSKALQSRYIFRPTSNRMRTPMWKHYLHNLEMVNEGEFLCLFRLQRATFYSLLHIVNEHERDATDYQPLQEVHLLVLLKYLGTCGNDSSAVKLALLFGIGYGTVLNYIRLAMKAILRLKAETVFWPGEEERIHISTRILSDYGFPNCVGIVDGTLFPLEFKPRLNGEDYFTRKGGYAVHSLIICDDQVRIRGITLGWAGSVHDNRVWLRSSYNQTRCEFFRPKEYLLGDSAFKPSCIMIPAFKKPFGQNLDPYKSFFNSKLAIPRILSEHCIGRLKGRFQLLKRLRVLIRTRKDVKRLNRCIMTCAVLHNLLLHDKCSEGWMEESEQDAFDDFLNDEDIEQDTGDRRDSIFSYLCERFR